MEIKWPSWIQLHMWKTEAFYESSSEPAIEVKTFFASLKLLTKKSCWIFNLLFLVVYKATRERENNEIRWNEMKRVHRMKGDSKESSLCDDKSSLLKECYVNPELQWWTKRMKLKGAWFTLIFFLNLVFENRFLGISKRIKFFVS